MFPREDVHNSVRALLNIVIYAYYCSPLISTLTELVCPFLTIVAPEAHITIQKQIVSPWSLKRQGTIEENLLNVLSNI